MNENTQSVDASYPDECISAINCRNAWVPSYVPTYAEKVDIESESMRIKNSDAKELTALEPIRPETKAYRQ